MDPDKVRPQFKKPKLATSFASPEDLFYKLPRRQTHGYLRGPQQDVLREYLERAATSADVAFELPTGTGKTAVGLLIAEWKRLSGVKVAYLSLTNQLASQVLAEAQKLGIPFADLRGTKETRDPEEEGRYRTAAGVGITTYSNLFNVNPVIRDADLLVFDDAHGAENYAASMWTVSILQEEEPDIYNSLLAALRPGLTESQVAALDQDSPTRSVDIPDICGHPDCIGNVLSILDRHTGNARFPWRLIRNHLKCCIFLLSQAEIAIRPLVPPTHTHQQFASPSQRLYLSATLGGEGDLLRAYGILSLVMIRAKSPQWGRRYVFVPGVHSDATKATQLAAEVWNGMEKKRAVLLAPSDRKLKKTYQTLEALMHPKPELLGSTNIADSLDSFVERTDVLLGLTRYDGLDLPDEQCRLLIMSESPAATNLLERYLIERWKMGPVLRKRERTRLIQGMGRCTRNATDFAVIIWLGQSLVNSATSAALLSGFPPELAGEIKWGLEQSGLSPGELVQMILGLIKDATYRKEADAGISSLSVAGPEGPSDQLDELGREEIRFARAMWDEDYERALEIAREISDQITSPNLAGYRAWWLYLSSIAARLSGSPDIEKECLRTAPKCGVNSGWLRHLLRQRDSTVSLEAVEPIEKNAEGLWDTITDWGWHGPRFEQKLTRMQQLLTETDHAKFHEGLDYLGRCFGAQITRTNEAGAPDVVWSFVGFHVAFEAKTEKKVDGLLFKREVQEAKGHCEWVRSHLCPDDPTPEISAVIVAPSSKPDQFALPFIGGLYYLAPSDISKLAQSAVEGLRKLRLHFAGRDFAEVTTELSSEMRTFRLDLASARKVLLSAFLQAN